jgi:hypothetical protein
MPKDDESSLPAVLVGLAVIVALVAAGGYYSLSKKSQARGMEIKAEFEALAAANKERREGHEGTIQDFEEAKLLCEKEAERVKKIATSQPAIEKALLTKGEELYSKAQKSSEACLDYLISTMKKRFDDVDTAELTKRVNDTARSTIEFLSWADREVDPTEHGSLFFVFENAPQWIGKFGRIRYEDAELDQIVDNLEKCRMKSWNEIK